MEMLTKISLDQLTSVLGELNKKEVYLLQDIGKDLIQEATLSPGIKSAVMAIFCVGAAHALAAAEDGENEKKDPLP